MLPRVEFEMSEKQLQEILDACLPTPVMYLPGGQRAAGDPQENANQAWARLGKEMGFIWSSVKPLRGRGQRFFSAVPTESKEPKAEGVRTTAWREAFLKYSVDDRRKQMQAEIEWLSTQLALLGE